MNRCDMEIDNGRAFDWGRVSSDYARYRDIYPDLFYQKLVDRGLCCDGQQVLDIGTGTGVLPRNMARYGAQWTGADASENQIVQARRLTAEQGLDISYVVQSAESLDFPAQSFDVITACQCFWYFDAEVTAPKLAQLLRQDGRLVILYMAWLPEEDAVARASEQLVLRYHPDWSGGGEVRHPIAVPDAVRRVFEPVYHEEYDLRVPFTRETWHGRMKACRGVGAALQGAALSAWEQEHRAMLERTAPEQFTVLHYAALAEWKKK